MNVIACMGQMIGTEGAILLLGIALAIAGILAGGAAAVISQVFKIGMLKALIVEAIALLVCGLVSTSLEWEWTARLTFFGAFTSGCLLVLGWMFNLMRGKRGFGGEQDFCSLELNDRSTVEAAK